MGFKLRILVVFVAFVFQMNTLKSQSDLDNVPVVLIGNNTSYEKIANSEIRQLFNGKYYRWPNNQSVMIVLPSSKHQKVELYSDLIYSRSFYAVKKYWYSLVFQGRFNPPHFFDSDQEIVDFVSKNKGSFSIVSEGKYIPDELRIEIQH